MAKLYPRRGRAHKKANYANEAQKYGYKYKYVSAFVFSTFLAKAPLSFTTYDGSHTNSITCAFTLD
jgi:hypothetical protein